jgi:replicative DNA helicase|uniref:Replicative DNA helicase n=1 Tax=Fistulifera solaris TaxID=1519565 RepID=F3Y7A1_FISSO|nr:DNA replication helicase [Fistulifera solaris]BAK18946.1 DNA replication helicase [Fistulifera solaris]
MNQSDLNLNQISINNSLPNNFLAEQIILSSLLTNQDVIEATTSLLSVEAFYFKNHQEIYRAIIFMNKNNFPIDIITLINFLQTNGLLEKTGGSKVLIDLVSQRPNVTHLREYINLVNDKFLRRSIIKIGYEIVNSSYTTSIPLTQILNELEEKIVDFKNQLLLSQSLDNVELLNSIFANLKSKSIEPSLAGLSSGFYDLDCMTQGFQKSDLIIIAGRPSIGKTALILNIVADVVRQSRLPVLLFSLEMSKEQILYRLLSIETQISQLRLKSGNLGKEDWVKISRVIPILAKVPLFIDDNFNLSIQDIRSKIKSILFEQRNLGLIVIDYLQLMQSSDSKIENRVQELAYTTRALKILAREFNVPIVVLSQLSRNVENRVDKRPILSDLRESGSIEQDADLILLLYKSSSYNQVDKQTATLIELIIAKQRNGPTGVVKLKFNPDSTKFLDWN